jgi:putative ABC transport system substrate-binding protein
MKRRDLLLASVGGFVTSLVRAQQARRPFRIAWTVIPPLSTLTHATAAFEQGLRDHGHVPGKDVLLEFRSGEGNFDKYQELVRDMVRGNPDLILTGTNVGIIPVRAATQTIPVVMAMGSNVVDAGLVKSLARPGGNITGLTVDVGPGIVAKRFELLREAAPKIRRLAVLYDSPYGTDLREVDESSAAALGIGLVRHEITDDFAGTFAVLARAKIDAVLIHASGRRFERRAELVALAAKHRMASMFPVEEYALSGGLLSYGPNLPDLFRRAAGFVSKIMRGAKPADLPVEQPVKLDLVINLKAAKALGLTVPQSLLLRADKVIE